MSPGSFWHVAMGAVLAVLLIAPAAHAAGVGGREDAAMRVSSHRDTLERLLALSQLDNELLELDTATGGGDPIAELDPVGDEWFIGGMDFDAGLGMLFAAEGGARRLLTIDPRSAAMALIGHMGTERAGAIACDEGAGVLYVVGCTYWPLERRSYLYRVSRFTAAVTYIGEIGYPDVSGIAFDKTTGMLYGACGPKSGTGGVLMTIDVDTGEASRVGSSIVVNDMSFDEEGQLYGVGCGSPCGFSCLYRIDKATGTATVAGLPGYPCVCSLAFAYLDDTPVEPRSWTTIKAMYQGDD